MILRFVCKFAPRPSMGFAVQPADAERQFVVSYFMNDDTISVFEPPIRNSGIIGGKFLERGLKYKPGTEEPYTYKARGTALSCCALCVAAGLPRAADSW
jgi:DUF1126 PH-like domain